MRNEVRLIAASNTKTLNITLNEYSPHTDDPFTISSVANHGLRARSTTSLGNALSGGSGCRCAYDGDDDDDDNGDDDGDGNGGGE